jgi:hypothetical protein
MRIIAGFEKDPSNIGKLETPTLGPRHHMYTFLKYEKTYHPEQFGTPPILSYTYTSNSLPRTNKFRTHRSLI